MSLLSQELGQVWGVGGGVSGGVKCSGWRPLQGRVWRWRRPERQDLRPTTAPRPRSAPPHHSPQLEHLKGGPRSTHLGDQCGPGPQLVAGCAQGLGSSVPQLHP